RRHTRWPRDWSSDVCSSDLDLASRYGGVKFTDTRVLDYSTFGSKYERMVRADRAYFLVGAPKASGASDDLKIVAFASRAMARKYQRQIGGELRDFEDADRKS